MLLVVVVCRALQLADLILISQSVTWMLELLLNLRLWKDAFSMAKYNVEDLVQYYMIVYWIIIHMIVTTAIYNNLHMFILSVYRLSAYF